MTKIGVFLPIGSRGWLISTTSPETYPTFDLNRTVTQRAEHYGFDFALSMIKLRGFAGPSEYWVHNLESLTLMAGIAAQTSKIQLFGSVGMLTIPPAVVARMTATIDSIAPGRFGVNIVTGWQPKEYEQMGIELGEEHFARRYDYASEYAQVMTELWETGQSDFKGDFFTMNDCVLSPRPAGHIPIIGAGQSDKGIEFVAKYGDYSFVAARGDTNQVTVAKDTLARVQKASAEHGRETGALLLVLIIADRTDELAWQKWEHYKSGTDLEALQWQADQAGHDKKASKDSTAKALTTTITNPKPTNLARLVGSYEHVAEMLDELADTPGLKGIMLAFDDFITGIEQFGQYIQPAMRSRRHIVNPAKAA
ncbi:pyrimidine utilization protein A [Allosediminivita pacifica]|uniref:Pyrimidine monooxygenase RutA n=1 Tax=Allosediminivita pacifica TaxID=1267769 RepID=A0A2T6ANI1_9RHOB|nr:pyrimidine utilization protein A [Allosediminivita pacifica]PTX45381.1 pyrimidine oxygenase [Allosediminivita pacifica]GGB20840.1 pyrimidine monooxygenase RutA [Allosediminivita pacifica]